MSKINLLVAGDFCPIGRFEPLVSKEEPERRRAVGEVAALAETADCFIVNLECPLTDSGTLIEKAGSRIKADPSAVRFLKDLRVDLVVMANNHILDFGEEGLTETLGVLRVAGIETVGAGLTHDEARRIHFRELKGRTLAVVNMAEREFSYARPGRCGANPFDLIAAVEAIREARKRADHVLLILHGGLESMNFPSPESVRLLRFLAEQGPTAIIRHHPHRVQGHEVWKGVPIFYSLGNFLFDWFTPVKDEGWYEGILVELAIDKEDQCSSVIHPFEQCKAEPGIKMLGGTSRDRFMGRYNEWSKTIGDDSALQKEWLGTVERRKNDYFGLLTLPHPLLMRVARRLGLLNYLRPSKSKRRILENCLRCDAHREVLLDVFERDREGMNNR